MALCDGAKADMEGCIPMCIYASVQKLSPFYNVTIILSIAKSIQKVPLRLVIGITRIIMSNNKCKYLVIMKVLFWDAGHR